jgi:tRNA threonylcarbamoyladenosine biosynthesis protein TsaB
VNAGPVLAFDASTPRACAALLGPDGEPWGIWQQPPDQPGTAPLAAGVAGLLAARGLRVEQLLGVVVGVGPGSYTGTRASVALARGLALASGVRLAAVVSAAAAARGEFRRNAAARAVIVLLDARRGEAYRADYERGDVRAGVVGAEGLPLECRAPGLVAGADADPRPADPSLIVLREPIPDAYDVAAVGRTRLLLGGDPSEVVRPLYLKRSHAEIVFDERVGSQGLGRD